MEPTPILPFPDASSDPVDRDLVDLEAGIAMVASGLAVRVRLIGLRRVDAVAAVGLARARAAGVEIRFERDASGVAAITLGPRR